MLRTLCVKAEATNFGRSALRGQRFGLRFVLHSMHLMVRECSSPLALGNPRATFDAALAR